MMKIPGNNSNGTAEMWEILACRGAVGVGREHGPGVISTALRAQELQILQQVSELLLGAGSRVQPFPLLVSVIWVYGELWFYGPGTGVWLYLQLQIIQGAKGGPRFQGELECRVGVT